MRGQGAFDELRGMFVVYGGSGLNGLGPYHDTWEYDVTTGLWAEHFDTPSPVVNPNYAAAYDSRRARVVVMGSVGNGSAVRETREFGGGVTSASFCFGDGSSALPCPCSNDAAPGSGSGCLNS